jgi:acyl-[acyl-carrier-protein]-phospholipid O-acyltransferase/long-chain-fatty-acid--[acyl-carrier-protein] ligase
MLEASEKKFKLKRYLRGDYLRKNMKTVTRKREIFEAIIALSLFWSISQVVLAIFGEYAKSNLHITNTIYVQGVMALAGIGIVVGSIVAAKLSKYFINMGLVGLGAMGMTTVVLLVPFTHFISLIAVWFLLFGVFSGFLMVPLNAKIQSLSSRVHLGTILAGNNFIQNIFMVTFLLLTTLFAYYGMDTEALFYLMGLVGAYLSFMTLKRYPSATFFAIMKIISSLRHNYNYVGLQNVPKEGAALLLSNHVSWLDWIILQLPIARHINYMMEKEIYHWPVFHTFFVKGEAIPLSARASKDAFLEAHKRLKNGKLVAIFSEGKISDDGKLHKFYKGFERIEKDYEGVIIPIFIQGVFGSRFAKYKGTNKKSFFKRREITVYYGEAMSKESSAQEVKAVIQKMKDKYETQ